MEQIEDSFHDNVHPYQEPKHASFYQSLDLQSPCIGFYLDSEPTVRAARHGPSGPSPDGARGF